jgi:TonB family protein
VKRSNALTSLPPPIVKEEKAAPITPVEPPPTPAIAVRTYEQKMPEVLRLHKPELPTDGWRLGSEAEIVVKVQVSKEGTPLKAAIVRSSNSLFNNAVIDAAMKSEYSPGYMPTGPVTTWLTVPFKLRR